MCVHACVCVCVRARARVGVLTLCAACSGGEGGTGTPVAPPTPAARPRSGSSASVPLGPLHSAAAAERKDAEVFYNSVDYDVWARFMVYLRKMPPVLIHVDEETRGVDTCFSIGAPMQLSVGSVVFLCDYDWLVAERARLRAKFRVAVRVVIVVYNFMRPLLRDDRPADRPRRISMVRCVCVCVCVCLCVCVCVCVCVLRAVFCYAHVSLVRCVCVWVVEGGWQVTSAMSACACVR